MTATTITIKPLYHRLQELMGIYCAKDPLINAGLKKINGIKWSATHQCWYLPLQQACYQQLKTQMAALATFNTAELKQYLQQKKAQVTTDAAERPPTKVPKGSEAPANKVPKAAAAKSNSNKQATPPLNAANAAAMAQYIQHLQLHSYSPSTIRTYQNELMQFFQTLGKHEARELPPSRLQDYLHWCHTTLQLSENTIHSRLNAMKYYYEQVLGKEKWFWEIPRPKKVEQLPKVISEEKIIEGLFSVEKLKHKVLLLVAYSAGLRVGEVVRLRICDIDSDRMQIKILAGKGKKDRVVPLSKHLLPLLRTFYTTYKPKYWLFEGEKTNEHYSTRSAQILFKQAFAKLNLPPNISFHSLRHSFATHLLDGGTDISYIQKILGHNDIKTTLIYAKVTNKDLAKIESPLDKMMNKKTP